MSHLPKVSGARGVSSAASSSSRSTQTVVTSSESDVAIVADLPVRHFSYAPDIAVLPPIPVGVAHPTRADIPTACKGDVKLDPELVAEAKKACDELREVTAPVECIPVLHHIDYFAGRISVDPGHMALQAHLVAHGCRLAHTPADATISGPGYDISIEVKPTADSFVAGSQHCFMGWSDCALQIPEGASATYSATAKMLIETWRVLMDECKTTEFATRVDDAEKRRGDAVEAYYASMERWDDEMFARIEENFACRDPMASKKWALRYCYQSVDGVPDSTYLGVPQDYAHRAAPEAPYPQTATSVPRALAGHDMMADLRAAAASCGPCALLGDSPTAPCMSVKAMAQLIMLYTELTVAAQGVHVDDAATGSTAVLMRSLRWVRPFDRAFEASGITKPPATHNVPVHAVPQAHNERRMAEALHRINEMNGLPPPAPVLDAPVPLGALGDVVDIVASAEAPHLVAIYNETRTILAAQRLSKKGEESYTDELKRVAAEQNMIDLPAIKREVREAGVELLRSRRVPDTAVGRAMVKAVIGAADVEVEQGLDGGVAIDWGADPFGELEEEIGLADDAGAGPLSPDEVAKYLTRAALATVVRTAEGGPARDGVTRHKGAAASPPPRQPPAVNHEAYGRASAAAGDRVAVAAARIASEQYQRTYRVVDGHKLTQIEKAQARRTSAKRFPVGPWPAAEPAAPSTEAQFWRTERAARFADAGKFRADIVAKATHKIDCSPFGSAIGGDTAEIPHMATSTGEWCAFVHPSTFRRGLPADHRGFGLDLTVFFACAPGAAPRNSVHVGTLSDRRMLCAFPLWRIAAHEMDHVLGRPVRDIQVADRLQRAMRHAPNLVTLTRYEAFLLAHMPPKRDPQKVCDAIMMIMRSTGGGSNAIEDAVTLHREFGSLPEYGGALHAAASIACATADDSVADVIEDIMRSAPLSGAGKENHDSAVRRDTCVALMKEQDGFMASRVVCSF